MIRMLRLSQAWASSKIAEDGSAIVEFDRMGKILQLQKHSSIH